MTVYFAVCAVWFSERFSFLVVSGELLFKVGPGSFTGLLLSPLRELPGENSGVLN